MAMPPRSEELGQPKDVQFAHFGVLDSGSQSKPSVFVSLIVNVIVLLRLHRHQRRGQEVHRQSPSAHRTHRAGRPQEGRAGQAQVRPPSPATPASLPDVAKIEMQLPRIVVVKPPDLPKPPEVKMDTPKPVIAAPAPVKVVAMAAPQAVNLAARPQAASVPNNDPHPSAVRLGNPNSPLNNLHGPAVSSVNLGAGFAGMNSANTGNGPRSTKVVLGNGSPEAPASKATAWSRSPAFPTASPRHRHRPAPSARSTSARPRRRPRPSPLPVASLVQPKPAKAHRQAQAGVHRRGPSAAYRRRRHPPHPGLGQPARSRFWASSAASATASTRAPSAPSWPQSLSPPPMAPAIPSPGMASSMSPFSSRGSNMSVAGRRSYLLCQSSFASIASRTRASRTRWFYITKVASRSPQGAVNHDFSFKIHRRCNALALLLATTLPAWPLVGAAPSSARRSPPRTPCPAASPPPPSMP